MEPTTSILKQATECFNNVRKNIYEGAELLYKIKRDELWKGVYTSFSEYLEEEVKVSDSTASKLCAIYSRYIAEGGLPLKQLQGVDHERAYMALRLEGSPAKQLASASSLSRSELRKEIRDPHDDCEHKNCGTICFDCHQRV